MKMFYRGVSYNRHPLVPKLQQTSPINSGMAYAQTTQLRFMGQDCRKQTVNLATIGKKTRFLGRICSDDLTQPTKVNVTV